MDDGVEELAPAQLPVQHGGDQQGIDHGDGRALHGGEDAGTDADEDQRDQAQAGQGGDNAQRHGAPAGEHFHAVAATSCHHIAGDHQCQRHQQRRYDARSEQIGDGQAPSRRRREQDQVVRWRYQQRHQRSGDADIDGEIAVIAALDHLRNHRATDRRHIGDG
ncbi:hypothetical protein G6F35_011499 [Rhizopus arrhizus]|nr:hypothetical protein G6F35_011499 [Rhizopus arrhizus]